MYLPVDYIKIEKKGKKEYVFRHLRHMHGPLRCHLEGVRKRALGLYWNIL